MASKLPGTGAETSVSLTVDGVPIILDGEIDGWTYSQVVDTIKHMPLGTQDVELGQNLGGFSGTIALKRGSNIFARAMDIISASTRLGIRPVVIASVTEKYPNGNKDAYLYRNIVLKHSGSSKRGENNGGEISWESGIERVRL